MKMVVDKFFHDVYKSIVVLANPKTLLNAKSTKKEITEKVIRADLKLHTPTKSDYAKKYKAIIDKMGTFNEAASEEKQDAIKKINGQTSDSKRRIDEELLVQKLKSFRLEKCREENIKPYYIFNDKQMKDLIEKMPDSKASLLKVSGFGDVKVEKYGEKILLILNDFR